MTIQEQAREAAERLAKWRSVFTGWQLGTRPKGDPETDAVRDHREATMLQRAEINALTALLIERGVFTVDDFHRQLLGEYEYLNKVYEDKFPGFTAGPDGMHIDTKLAAETTKTWRP